VSGFKQLADKLKALSKAPSVIASEAARNIKQLIISQTNSGKDPYGRNWAPLKIGGSPQLFRLLSGFDIKVSGNKLELLVSAVPIIFHQVGTKYMPARPILSTGVFPKTWEKAIESAFQKAMSM